MAPSRVPLGWGQEPGSQGGTAHAQDSEPGLTPHFLCSFTHSFHTHSLPLLIHFTHTHTHRLGPGPPRHFGVTPGILFAPQRALASCVCSSIPISLQAPPSHLSFQTTLSCQLLACVPPSRRAQLAPPGGAVDPSLRGQKRLLRRRDIYAEP